MAVADVIVIGAGPVGLLMAAELHRRGVDVDILEGRSGAAPGSRAIGVHSPVLAALEESGLTDQLLTQAVRIHRGQARSRGALLGTIDFGRLAARHGYVAALPQSATEEVLARAAPNPRWGVQVTAVRVGQEEVEVHAWVDAGAAAGIEQVQVNTRADDRGGQGLHQVYRAPLVVLAGGARARALVYRRPEAQSYPDRYLMTDMAAAGDADPHTAVIHLNPQGVTESFPLPNGRRRYVTWDHPAASRDPEQQHQRMRQNLTQVTGDPRAGAAVEQVTGFGVRRFVPEAMRDHRLMVIGDAAHEVSPIGGQGMNLGLLDAVTLAPLLAWWVDSSVAPQQALGSWEAQRIASARTAARLAEVNTVLGRPASPVVNRVRRSGLRAALAPGVRGFLTRAYAMGFDRADL